MRFRAFYGRVRKNKLTKNLTSKYSWKRGRQEKARNLFSPRPRPYESLCCIRYSFGVFPVIFLNRRLRWCGYWNPIS